MNAPVEAQRVAPLWKRWIASVLDSMPWLIMALPFLVESRRDDARRPSRALELAVAAFSAAYQISLTTTIGQTIGQRVVGIGVVDAKRATVPTLRQSMLRWVLTSVPEAVSRLQAYTNVEKVSTANADLQAEIERLKQRHRGDRQGLNEAMMALYKDRDVNPMEACLPGLLRGVPAVVCSCLLYCPALRGPLHQGLHDRAAGTVVVVVDNHFRRRG